MQILILLMVVALPLCWLIAEFRAERRARIILGVTSMLAVPVLVFAGAQTARKYDHDFMRFGFDHMKHLVLTGRTNEVLTAIGAYQRGVKLDTAFTLHGSSRFFHMLTAADTNSEPQGAASGRQPDRFETNQPQVTAGSRRSP